MIELDSWDNPNAKDRIVTKEMSKPKPQKTIKWFSEEEITDIIDEVIDKNTAKVLKDKLFGGKK